MEGTCLNKTIVFGLDDSPKNYTVTYQAIKTVK